MSAAKVRRVVLLRPRGDDAFPAIELEAAAPCRVEDEDQVLIPSGVDPDGARAWAALLGSELQGRVWSIRALADCPDWTHCLRVMLEDGSSRDFAVVARGLPADELEALQQGYEYGELDLVVLPHHGRSRLN